MSKRGFTLTELLAVIVVLSITMLIASSGIRVIYGKINENMLETRKKLILEGGKQFGIENRQYILGNSCLINELKYSNCKIMKVKELIPEFLSTNEKCNGVLCIKNDVTGENMNEDEMAIYIKNNRVHSTFDYELIE